MWFEAGLMLAAVMPTAVVPSGTLWLSVSGYYEAAMTQAFDMLVNRLKEHHGRQTRRQRVCESVHCAS